MVMSVYQDPTLAARISSVNLQLCSEALEKGWVFYGTVYHDTPVYYLRYDVADWVRQQDAKCWKHWEPKFGNSVSVYELSDDLRMLLILRWS